MSKPEFVYVIYIASTPEKVFAALTDAKMSEQYWAGNRVVSDWKIGAAFALKLKREETDVTGKVLEYDPPRRLAYSFHPQHGGMDGEPPSRVTFEIEQQKDQVKLTLSADKKAPFGQIVKVMDAAKEAGIKTISAFTKEAAKP